MTRRWGRGLAFGALSFVWFLLIVGVSDLLFWGKAFSSLSHAVDFTLVQRLSSRGFEPFHYYLSSTTAWADWVLLAFLTYGVIRAPLRLSAWFLVPVTLLTCLPHKEARYLVPAMPFAAILSAYGFWRLMYDRPRRVRVSDGCWRFLLVGGLCTLLLLETDGFRFRRSEAAIQAVSSVASREGASVVALENSWMAGGRLFLMETPAVLQLRAETLASPDGLNRFLSERHVDVVGLTALTAMRPRYADVLVRHGFTEEEQKVVRPTYRVFWRRIGTAGASS